MKVTRWIYGHIVAYHLEKAINREIRLCWLGHLLEIDSALRAFHVEATGDTSSRGCSIIVWEESKQHSFSVYKDIGRYTVHQIHDYIMVGKLSLGGSIIKKTENLILLDNAFMLQRLGNYTNSTIQTERFFNFSRN